MDDNQKLKVQAIARVKGATAAMWAQLSAIDERLLEYFEHLGKYASAEPGDENDLHCTMELLGGLKFLRLMYEYEIDVQSAQKAIRLREGEWHKEGKMWKYDKGGLLLPGTGSSMTHYRWEPFQVFTLVAKYGLKAWVNTEDEAGSRELRDTERVGADGMIEDLRRLCTDFTLYGPRKIDKTGIAAYDALLFFMLGDNNAEILCTANAAAQSKILFGRAKTLIRQLDPKEQRIRFTASEVNWKPGQFRSASMMALSAGGKTKDGLFAQLCCADEYGSAPYVNGKSDMGALVNVVQSSMGPRREPMTVTTTTAGNITAGPFIEKLAGMKAELVKEVEKEWSKADRLLSANDRWLCLILEPDEWEREEDYMLTSRTLRRKVNPMLGKIVQHSFYEQAAADSLLDPMKKIETLTKLFNVYRSSSVEEWIKAEQVRPLQRKMRIDDCTAKDGWVVFVGLDFSQGDDLHTAAYLAARKHPSGRGTEFFADCDCWVKESSMQRSSIRPIYESWVKEGWLHVSPGMVFQPSLFIHRLDELFKKGVQFMTFGYDKYQSKDPINALKAFLQTIGVADPDPYVQVVSQLNSEFNAPTDDLHAAMFAPIPYISFSNSPLWPFCFGNCVLEIDNRENKRPVKRNQADSCKIDPVQAIIMGMDLYTRIG